MPLTFKTPAYYVRVSFYKFRKARDKLLTKKPFYPSYLKELKAKSYYVKRQRKGIESHTYLIYVNADESKKPIEQLEKALRKVVKRIKVHKTTSATVSIQKFEGKVLNPYRGLITGTRTKQVHALSVHKEKVIGKSFNSMITKLYNRMFGLTPDEVQKEGMFSQFERVKMIGYTVSETKSKERKKRTKKKHVKRQKVIKKKLERRTKSRKK
jgi:hypothetical protein